MRISQQCFESVDVVEVLAAVVSLVAYFSYIGPVYESRCYERNMRISSVIYKATDVLRLLREYRFEQKLNISPKAVCTL